MSALLGLPGPVGGDSEEEDTDQPLSWPESSLGCFCTVVWANPAFPGALAVGNLPTSAGGTGSVPDPGRVHVPRGNQVHELRWLSPCSATKERCGGERPPLPHPDRGHTQQQGASAAQVKQQLAKTMGNIVH